jgi:hypothetical protein
MFGQNSSCGFIGISHDLVVAQVCQWTPFSASFTHHHVLLGRYREEYIWLNVIN